MSWVKLDDSFFRNPKAQAAGKDGRALFLAGLCHCAAALTDGLILRSSLPLLAAEAGVRQSVSKRLVDAGLWEECDLGWMAHAYLEYNPPRSDVEDERERARERMRRVRQKRDRSSGEHNPNEQENFADGSPSPVPSRPLVVTEPTSSTTDSHATAQPVDNVVVAIVNHRLTRLGKANASDGYRRSVGLSIDGERARRLQAAGWAIDDIDRMLEQQPGPVELGIDPLAETLRAQTERMAANAAWAQEHPEPERDPAVIANGLASARAARHRPVVDPHPGDVA